MSRDRDAKQLAESQGIRYTHALRLVREARERCVAMKHLDAPCGPYCLLVRRDWRTWPVPHWCTGSHSTCSTCYPPDAAGGCPDGRPNCMVDHSPLMRCTSCQREEVRSYDETCARATLGGGQCRAGL